MQGPPSKQQAPASGLNDASPPGGSWRRLRAAGGALTLALALGCADGIEVEGDLQVLVARYPDWSSRVLHVLVEDDGTITSLEFADPPPRTLQTGLRLVAVGTRKRESLRVHSFWVQPRTEPGHERLSRALLVDSTAPPRPRKLATILFNFKDDPREPVRSEQVREHVFTRPSSTVAFMKEQSYGHLVLEGKARTDGDVFGWYTLPFSSTTCDPHRWASASVAAAQREGVDLRAYDHLVFVFPQTRACVWAGLGQARGSYTWINGASLPVINHELGHNFNLSHADSYTCLDTQGARTTLSERCTASEYGNPLDVMGNAGNFHTNVVNKLRAGWLGDSNLRTVTESGTFLLEPQQRPSAGLQVLRVPRTATHFYYLEFRASFGFDNFPEAHPAVNGLLVLLASEHERYSNSLLLDMTPETPSFVDASLLVGRTYHDPQGRIRITFVEKTPAGAVVKVDLLDGEVPIEPRSDGGSDSGRMDPDAGTQSGPSPDGPSHQTPIAANPDGGAVAVGARWDARRTENTSPSPFDDEEGDAPSRGSVRGFQCAAGPVGNGEAVWLCWVLFAAVAFGRKRRPWGG
jgi:hypothetical protein